MRGDAGSAEILEAPLWDQAMLGQSGDDGVGADAVAVPRNQGEVDGRAGFDPGISCGSQGQRGGGGPGRMSRRRQEPEREGSGHLPLQGCCWLAGGKQDPAVAASQETHVFLVRSCHRSLRWLNFGKRHPSAQACGASLRSWFAAAQGICTPAARMAADRDQTSTTSSCQG